MKITINKTYINYKSKDGKPYKTPRVSIYGKDENGKDVKNATGFVSKDSAILSMVAGDVVDVELEQKGQYLNFTVLGGSTDDTEEELGKTITPPKKPVDLSLLEERIRKLEDQMFDVMGRLALEETKKKASNLPF